MTTFKNDFFDVNITILKWSGIWIPGKDVSLQKRIGYYMFNSFWIIYSVFIFTPAEFITLRTTATNLGDLVKNLNMAMTHFLATIKVTIWFTYRKEILYIINTLRSNAVAYEPIDDFNPEEIVKEDKKVKDAWTVMFLSTACLVSISAVIPAFDTLIRDNAAHFVYQTDAYNVTKAVYEQKLPYYSWIPWDHTSSKFNFGAAILFQFFPVFNFAFIIVGFDTLLTSIISYTSCQIKIIQGAFRTVRERCLKRLNIPNDPMISNTPYVNAELNKELIRGIKALQVIFIMCDKVESIFAYVTLVQVLISLVVFCTCLYLVSFVPIASETFFVELIYLIAIEFQLALYCYFGNKVTQRGEDIPLSLYEGDWLGADYSFKRSMLITMTRMRRPIYLTIGKFSPLTLSTFVTIGRASYSFFAVLKNSNL